MSEQTDEAERVRLAEIDQMVCVFAKRGKGPGEIWQRVYEARSIEEVCASIRRLRAAGRLPKYPHPMPSGMRHAHVHRPSKPESP